METFFIARLSAPHVSVAPEPQHKAQAALGKKDAAVPEFLGEDNLARFGAYWSS